MAMRRVRIYNSSRVGVRPVTAGYCERFLCQLRGLTFRRNLPADEGLLLVQRGESRLEAAIHMLAMRMDLSVVWINTAGRVVDVRLARRWRPMYLPRRPARYVLEIAAARFDDFRIGDAVRFDEV